MAIAIRRAQTTWEGPLASGTGLIRMGSGAAGELAVSWASRTERADGKTSPEELAAAAHSACYAMALSLRLGEHEAFFRGLGRAYGLAGGSALAMALASGAVLASRYRWDRQLAASTVVAAALVASTAAGVAQAQRMTRLRQNALRDPGSPELAAKVRQGARNATVLRATIAALSLALLGLGTVIAT